MLAPIASDGHRKGKPSGRYSREESQDPDGILKSPSHRHRKSLPAERTISRSPLTRSNTHHVKPSSMKREGSSPPMSPKSRSHHHIHTGHPHSTSTLPPSTKAPAPKLQGEVASNFTSESFQRRKASLKPPNIMTVHKRKSIAIARAATAEAAAARSGVEQGESPRSPGRSSSHNPGKNLQYDSSDHEGGLSSPGLSSVKSPPTLSPITAASGGGRRQMLQDSTQPEPESPIRPVQDTISPRRARSKSLKQDQDTVVYKAMGRHLDIRADKEQKHSKVNWMPGGVNIDAVNVAQCLLASHKLAFKPDKKTEKKDKEKGLMRREQSYAEEEFDHDLNEDGDIAGAEYLDYEHEAATRNFYHPTTSHSPVSSARRASSGVVRRVTTVTTAQAAGGSTDVHFQERMHSAGQRRSSALQPLHSGPLVAQSSPEGFGGYATPLSNNQHHQPTNSLTGRPLGSPEPSPDGLGHPLPPVPQLLQPQKLPGAASSPWDDPLALRASLLDEIDELPAPPLNPNAPEGVVGFFQLVKMVSDKRLIQPVLEVANPEEFSSDSQSPKGSGLRKKLTTAIRQQSPEPGSGSEEEELLIPESMAPHEQAKLSEGVVTTANRRLSAVPGLAEMTGVVPHCLGEPGLALHLEGLEPGSGDGNPGRARNLSIREGQPLTLQRQEGKSATKSSSLSPTGNRGAMLGQPSLQSSNLQGMQAPPSRTLGTLRRPSTTESRLDRNEDWNSGAAGSDGEFNAGEGAQFRPRAQSAEAQHPKGPDPLGSMHRRSSSVEHAVAVSPTFAQTRRASSVEPEKLMVSPTFVASMNQRGSDAPGLLSPTFAGSMNRRSSEAPGMVFPSTSSSVVNRRPSSVEPGAYRVSEEDKKQRARSAMLSSKHAGTVGVVSFEAHLEDNHKDSFARRSSKVSQSAETRGRSRYSRSRSVSNEADLLMSFKAAAANPAEFLGMNEISPLTSPTYRSSPVSSPRRGRNSPISSPRTSSPGSPLGQVRSMRMGSPGHNSPITGASAMRMDKDFTSSSSPAATARGYGLEDPDFIEEHEHEVINAEESGQSPDSSPRRSPSSGSPNTRSRSPSPGQRRKSSRKRKTIMEKVSKRDIHWRKVGEVLREMMRSKIDSVRTLRKYFSRYSAEPMIHEQALVGLEKALAGQDREDTRKKRSRYVAQGPGQHPSQPMEQDSEEFDRTNDSISRAVSAASNSSEVQTSPAQAEETEAKPKSFSEDFFTRILPEICKRAEKITSYFPKGHIPVLRSDRDDTINLTRVQVASVVANMFLCAMPNNEISFANLLCSQQTYQVAKLRFFIHYFDRLSQLEDQDQPEGFVHIIKNTPNTHFDWVNSNITLKSCKVKFGELENEKNALNIMQSHANLGGGLLYRGRGAEEIRFCLYPELSVAMFVCNKLNNHDSVMVKGAERYSAYVGDDGLTLRFDGDFRDETPKNTDGTVLSACVFMDPNKFERGCAISEQMGKSVMYQDLTKLFCGLRSTPDTDMFQCVATGHWGCDHFFNGNAEIKILLQWMAASAAQKPLVHLVSDCREDRQTHVILNSLANKAVEASITVGQLFQSCMDVGEYHPRLGVVLARIAKALNLDIEGAPDSDSDSADDQ